MKAATVTHIRIKSTPNRGKSSRLSPAILWIHTTSLDKKSVNPASDIQWALFDLKIFTGGKSILMILWFSNFLFFHQHLAMESKKFCGSSVASEDQNIQVIMPLAASTFVFSSLCSVSLWVSGNGKLWLVCWKDWCVLASLPLTRHHSPFVLRPTLLTTNATLHNTINEITQHSTTIQHHMTEHHTTQPDTAQHNTTQYMI